MKTDIEITEAYQGIPISTLAQKLGIEPYFEPYGKWKGKIDLSLYDQLQEKEEGKLILVTSTSPTPMGEGKTTMVIGLHDALCKLGYHSLATLREPSLGPVFGIKGGATGGGYAQVYPMDEINLHFTGDMHAITSANNLLSAAIDNHIYQGNELHIDENKIVHTRCLDINDRNLREIEVGCGKQGVHHREQFVITVATELMAILCLSDSLADLKRRIGNMLIAYDVENQPICVSDLHVEDAMTILLKDALKPNLVQTLEGNPVLIHGGPFANIAHGCNSLLATKLALKLSDYVVTEAGFGSDLGAEKFLDIKCPKGNLKPHVIVLNMTIRSMKYHGGVSKDQLAQENVKALEKGMTNLKAHLENMRKYTSHVVVCINQFPTDSHKELSFVKKALETLHVPYACSTAYQDGGKGSVELAKTVIQLCQQEPDFHPLYEMNLSLTKKIETIATEIYHAKKVCYQDGVLEKLKEYENMGATSQPVCIAKTQYSFSDDAKKLGDPRDFVVEVKDVKWNRGAEFVVVYMGNIMTMPGLSKKPAMTSMHITNNGHITGLF